MKILALEFSSSKRGAAVIAEGVVQGHAEMETGLATPALALVGEALTAGGMKLQQIDRIAVGLGPGSYTGIRMALALIQGFAISRPVETVGVSSMLAVATDAPRPGVPQDFHVAIDAQRGEFYLGQYEVFDGRVRETCPVRIVKLTEIHQLLRTDRRVIAPDLASILPEAWPLLPDARTVGNLAADAIAGGPVEHLRPIYLRQTAFAKVGFK